MGLGRGRVVVVAAVALTGAALALGALAGCGGSGSSTTGGSSSGGSTTGGSSSTATTSRPEAPAPGTGAASGKGRYAIEQPASSRGIKGESPETEAATSLRIRAGDCAALAAAAGHSLGRSLASEPKPTPPLSKCMVSGHGVAINVFLDSGFAAHQRYMNRMEETVQFGAPDPRKVPHPVPNVGEKGAYNENASWVPALGSLFAVRGNRYLTVAYSVAGESNHQSREGAADLARLAFHLTAG